VDESSAKDFYITSKEKLKNPFNAFGIGQKNSRGYRACYKGGVLDLIYK